MMNLITKPLNINQVEDLLSGIDDSSFIKSNKRIQYLNIPCVIDIEVSSFYENQNKRACMYAFVFGINGKCIFGRTYQELTSLLKTVSERLSLGDKRRMIIYVHNLSYEWQFIRKRFNWIKVFAIEERKPLYAICDLGIEFRCSYHLSGYSLETIGKNLTKYKVEKLVGDLDYSLIRHSGTPMTEKEIQYVVHDGLVVMAYIQEEIEKAKNNISYIPLTKTGKVRNYCRNRCLYNGNHTRNQTKFHKYRTLMNHLIIQSPQEYEQLQRAFHGGFTHANSLYVNRVVKDVSSFDFTSSYPFVMVSERFPMGAGELIEIHSKEELEKNLSIYCCLFDIEFINIECRFGFIDHPISQSKCYVLENPLVDNGRVVSANRLATTLTEQDFAIIKEFYKWDKMKIRNFRRYRKGYLPRDFVKSILDLYKTKTELKNVEESIVEYNESKEKLNSCYGMTVTDPCRGEITYNPESESGFTVELPDIIGLLQKYNKSVRRFLFYAWGVWVTAYAERNLFTGILECKEDYVYSDTDSIKIRHKDKHMKYIDDYNKNVIRKLKRAMEWHNLPMDYVMPKTITGKVKILGLWDYEMTYDEFKTLGAKRYMVKTKDGFKYGDEIIPYSLTMSGVNKRYAIPYLYKTYKDDIMEAFTNGLYIPCHNTGKNIHTYIDEEISGEVTDYTGKKGDYHELSCIHMEECDYELSLSREFVDFLMGIQEFVK